MKRKNHFIVFSMIFLIICIPFSTAQIFDFEEREKEAQTGEAIIVEVHDYDPDVLPESVIEDGDVPVYAYLTGITFGRLLGTKSNVEPLYSQPNIKQVLVRPLDDESSGYVRGSVKSVSYTHLTLPTN